MELLSKSELQTAVHAALKAWGDLAGTATNLLEPLLLVQQARAQANGDSPTTRRLATNQVLLNGIETMEEQEISGSEILRLRFMEDNTILMAGNKLSLTEDQTKRHQREAINNLTQIIWDHEMAIRQEQIQLMQANLMPSGYNQLFGVDTQAAELVSLLQKQDAPWVIALVGIGGIGKTSLADTAVRQAIQQFQYRQVVWYRVSQTKIELGEQENKRPKDIILHELAKKLCPNLPQNASFNQCKAQLNQTLKQIPHLVIIDNIETDNEVAFLPEELAELANPSKFLLTTRVRLPASTSVHNLTLSELSLEDATNLLRHQAQAINLQELAKIPTEVVEQIYEVTGGNPLAMKLVVGLTAVLPLPQILEDLTQVHTSEIEEMYRRIYWRAWRNLDENAQSLLEMMPMSAGIGMKPEQIQASVDLSDSEFWTAIKTLVNRSLLEVRGTIMERRYGIHQLTNTFLQTEIIHWPE